MPWHVHARARTRSAHGTRRLRRTARQASAQPAGVRISAATLPSARHDLSACLPATKLASPQYGVPAFPPPSARPALTAASERPPPRPPIRRSRRVHPHPAWETGGWPSKASASSASSVRWAGLAVPDAAISAGWGCDGAGAGRNGLFLEMSGEAYACLTD